MSPAALATFRILRTLDLRPVVLRKITIASNGHPSFTALSNDEFDALKRAIHRVYPHYANVVWKVMDPPQELQYDSKIH